MKKEKKIESSKLKEKISESKPERPTDGIPTVRYI